MSSCSSPSIRVPFENQFEKSLPTLLIRVKEISNWSYEYKKKNRRLLLNWDMDEILDSFLEYMEQLPAQDGTYGVYERIVIVNCREIFLGISSIIEENVLAALRRKVNQQIKSRPKKISQSRRKKKITTQATEKDEADLPLDGALARITLNELENELRTHEIRTESITPGQLRPEEGFTFALSPSRLKLQVSEFQPLDDEFAADLELPSVHRSTLIDHRQVVDPVGLTVPPSNISELAVPPLEQMDVSVESKEDSNPFFSSSKRIDELLQKIRKRRKDMKHTPRRKRVKDEDGQNIIANDEYRRFLEFRKKKTENKMIRITQNVELRCNKTYEPSQDIPPPDLNGDFFKIKELTDFMMPSILDKGDDWFIVPEPSPNYNATFGISDPTIPEAINELHKQYQLEKRYISTEEFEKPEEMLSVCEILGLTSPRRRSSIVETPLAAIKPLEHILPMDFEAQIGPSVEAVQSLTQPGQPPQMEKTGLTINQYKGKVLNILDDLCPKCENSTAKFTELCPLTEGRLVAASVFFELIELWSKKKVDLSQTSPHPDNIFIKIIQSNTSDRSS